MAPRKPTPAGALIAPDPATPALETAALSRVEITVGPFGAGKPDRILINGVDISNITQAVRVRASVHSLPTVTLRLVPRELVVVADAITQPTCAVCADKLRHMTPCATVAAVINPANDEAAEDGAPF